MEGLSSLAPFLLMFAVIYLFMIRPQMKRQKNEKNFVANLKKGDLVVTKSGLHGKIVDLMDQTCVIETMAGKIKFDLSAVSMEMSSKVQKPQTKK